MPSLIESTAIKRLDMTSNVENLKPETLSIADNGRFTSDGRVEVRLGHILLRDLGTDARVDNIHTHDRLDVMFAKSGTAIYQSTDWVDHAYTTGLTRTAGEIDAIETIEKNVFITNQTDAFTRVAVSKIAAVDSVAATLSVTTGDGENFSSATFYVRGIAVSSGTLSTDDYTGCVGLTAAMAVGDIVTQTSEPANAPKGNAISELEGSTLVSNKASKPSVVGYSAPRTDDNPEYAYDFTTVSGGGSDPATTDCIAMGKINNGVLFGLKKGINFVSQFDATTDELTVNKNPVHDQHGVYNFRAFAQGQNITYVLTNTNRVLPIVNDDSGCRIVDPKDQTKALDWAIRSDLQKMDKSQTLSGAFYDPLRSEVIVNVSIDGLYREYVLNESLGTWSRDFGKPFMSRTYLNGKVYAGSDNDGKIYEENYGRTDNTIPIESFFATGVLTKKPKRTTFEFTNLIFSGLLNATGEFTLKVKVRDVILTYDFTAKYLINKGYMSLQDGVFIGAGAIGGELIGSIGQFVEAFPFVIPFDFLLEGESIQLQMEVAAEGTAFAWGDFAINPPEKDVLLSQST